MSNILIFTGFGEQHGQYLPNNADRAYACASVLGKSSFVTLLKPNCEMHLRRFADVFAFDNAL